MMNPNGNGSRSATHDRRRYPRYYVSSRITLAIEDESLKESIGIGEPQDISLGGVPCYKSSGLSEREGWRSTRTVAARRRGCTLVDWRSRSSFD